MLQGMEKEYQPGTGSQKKTMVLSHMLVFCETGTRRLKKKENPIALSYFCNHGSVLGPMKQSSIPLVLMLYFYLR